VLAVRQAPAGVLLRVAKEVGATKIALGHHVDDFIETLLLNLSLRVR
jgi:tRNA(Ile)-lysidine synthase TilS/MesJ